MKILTRTPIPSQLNFLPPFYQSVQVTNEKDGIPEYKPLYCLEHYKQWRPNDFLTTALIVVDIDIAHTWHVEALEKIKDHPALTPAYILYKRENGHGQIGWRIHHVSHGPNSHFAPQRYLKAVKSALTSFFDGDPSYVNSRAWNPFFKGWYEDGYGDVMWMNPEPRHLGELHQALKEAGAWNPAPLLPGAMQRKAIRDTSGYYGRNHYIFTLTRTRKRGTAYDVAHALNQKLDNPLPSKEVDGIVRNIERYEASHGSSRGGYGGMSEEARKKMSEWGRKGGSANTDKQKTARAKGPAAASVIRSAEKVGRAAQAKELRAAGYTRGEIAEKMGISKSTVSRLWK